MLRSAQRKRHNAIIVIITIAVAVAVSSLLRTSAPARARTGRGWNGMDVTYLILRTVLARRPISTASNILFLFLYSRLRKVIVNRELEATCYLLLLLLFPKPKHKYVAL